MDKNLALSTSYDSSTNLPLTFGPEWLNKEHSFPQAESSHDEGGRHISPKGRPPLLGKNRLPLKFTRSKSSPLLLQPPKPPEEILKEKASAATSPEPNQPGNFDKNFPTLSTKAPPAKATTVSAWKQPPIDVITNPKAKEATKQNGHSSEDKSDDLEHLKGLVPSTAPPPPKVLRNNHPPKKPSPKVNSPSGPKPIVPKPPFNKSMFRKASSEPTLPLNPTYQEKYAKLLAQGSKNSSASSSGSNTPERKDAGSDAEKNKTFDSRTDFFLGLLKEEQRRMKQQTDPNEKDHSSDNGETKVKSPALNMEDEERFLRDLGWVPEEEAHVPELTEQEILEVRAKIVPHKERPTVTFNLQKKFTSVSIDPEFS